MIRILSITTAALAVLLLPAPALAQSYPVSGKWTYDNPTAEGPAQSCGERYMSFEGNQRRDTGGGVAGYRNISVDNVGDGTFQIVDAFSTGQINARSAYTLRKVDADHIVIDVVGNTIRLRRCG
jgi:hypothetical protein